MVGYTLKRVLYMVPTLIAISFVSFFIIQLPPGDFLTTMVARMEEQGETFDRSQVAALEERYGLNQPFPVQYWKWISGIVFHGDFGQSFYFRQPVQNLIWDRLGLTFVLSLSTLLFIWAVALPIGVYSAVRKYSIGDYVATFLRLYRACHAQFFGRADSYVHFFQVFWSERRRAVLARIFPTPPGVLPRWATCWPTCGYP